MLIIVISFAYKCRTALSELHRIVSGLCDSFGQRTPISCIACRSIFGGCARRCSPAALLALASFAGVLAEARPAASLALASSVAMLSDARPAALLALASVAVVLADCHR